MEYIKSELHCHTLNSDGKFTVRELIEEMREIGVKAMSITDHNTKSAYFDDYLKTVDDITILDGIEWTTFFGHVLVLGAEKFVDWRYAKPNTIDKYLKEIKKYNGIIGVAHPYQQGSPICTGCHFDFEIEDFNNVNYIEVWSREFPTNAKKNQKAYKLWLDTLKKGYRLCGFSGRDLHEKQEAYKNFANTYLGIEGENSPSKMKEAIEKGRVFVSLGEKLCLEIKNEEGGLNLGDEILSSEIEVSINMQKCAEIIPQKVRVRNNDKFAFEGELGDFKVKTEKGFVIFEIYGEYYGEKDKLIAFTSPIYIK